jgi:hypothetical protein
MVVVLISRFQILRELNIAVRPSRISIKFDTYLSQEYLPELYDNLDSSVTSVLLGCVARGFC